MGSPRSKVLTPLLGRPLLAWTLEPMLELDLFSEILVACSPEDRDLINQLLKQIGNDETSARSVIGGQTRQDSVANCLREISVDCDLVAVHDGARPLLTSQLMLDVLNRANETGAAIAAVPCRDTVKLCNEEGIVSETLDRSRIWLVQTPQCFRHRLLVAAHEKARQEGYTATDDSALVERSGAAVHVVPGSHENVKVTTPEDIVICEEILRGRQL
ncbi:MAG: 2-C-methyl-D-erythritol 4-phosphate cytidylyltransferase [Candidatus Hydrogenedentota bacterium]|nr:MAG: 2-C-methyl-D-erythritol 4-phosphate cytidylyltransferase [Candidatus Hydrogenedentota bacterium]